MNSDTTPWRDEETLERLYLDEQLSTYEIADELGCTRVTISNWLERFGIDRRGRQPDPCVLEDEALTRRLYVEQELSLAEVANEIGCSMWKVRYWIDRHDIETREGGGSRFATPELQDEAWLRERYEDDNMSTAEIGDIVDCSARTVFYWLDKYDIQTSLPDDVIAQLDDPERMRELYEDQEMTGTDIADFLGCSEGVVSDRLREYGITGFSMVGSDHPRWNGGQYAYGPGWTESRRAAVRGRDHYECQGCGMTNEQHQQEHKSQLHVHHIRKARDVEDPDERNSMENLITLCASCHMQAEKFAPELPNWIE